MTLEELQAGKIFLINKPLEWTSFQVVKKLKFLIQKKFNIKKIKIGYSGTLDPLATGLLVICTGKMTKKIPEIQETKKIYTGEIKLGAETPSYDLETEIIKTYPIDNITYKNVILCAESFLGESMQKPPIFSALKKDGKRAYELAREGKEVELNSRKINIEEFSINSFKNGIVSFKIKCSKGTYIRSIAYDFGKKLNNGGHLIKLERENIGDFNINNSYTIEEVISLFSN